MKRGKFVLDRANGKLFGVCAGIAAATGIDATIIRIGFVVATVAGGWPWTVVAYVAAAFIAKERGRPLFERKGSEREESAARPGLSTHRMTGEMRDIDRRLAEVETYVTSGNSSLEREIEKLRA
ncbi:MAG: PspC domain-containing protein [Allosphingosinicella sp.]